MRHIPQDESIWGNINTAVEIALNVYYIYAENGEGIMIPKDKAKEVISEKAAAMGEENNGFLCYGKDENADIPMYEILQRRIALCEKIKNLALSEIQEIQRGGSVNLTDYFGECEPPVDTPDSPAAKTEKIRNGIYFVSVGGKPCFAVHEKIADHFLSPMAHEFSKKTGGYLYYDLTASSIPLHELRRIYSEIDSLIVSEDSLYATLNSIFPAYLSRYNGVIAEKDRISDLEAPENLFLQRQLDSFQTETEIQTGKQERKTDYFYEQDYDYGFEP